MGSVQSAVSWAGRPVDELGIDFLCGKAARTDLCGGRGVILVPTARFFENGRFDSTETLFCRLTKKAVIDVVLKRMERAFDDA